MSARRYKQSYIPYYLYDRLGLLLLMTSIAKAFATENEPAPLQLAYDTKRNHQKSELDCKVDDAIETFLRTLTPIGPELMAGCLTLSFYERKAKNKLFGLVHQEEKVVWEQWVLRVVVNNTPRPMGGDEASVIERQRIQDTAEGMLKAVLLCVFELAGNEIDHIPSTMYDFDLSITKKPDDRDEVYSRVSNMPALIKLGS